MSWLGLVFIEIVGVSAFMGLKIDLIRAGFTALGIFVGRILGPVQERHRPSVLRH